MPRKATKHVNSKEVCLQRPLKGCEGYRQHEKWRIGKRTPSSYSTNKKDPEYRLEAVLRAALRAYWAKRGWEPYTW